MQRHQDVVCKTSQIVSFAKLQTWCVSDACFGAGETRPVSCSVSDSGSHRALGEIRGLQVQLSFISFG